MLIKKMKNVFVGLSKYVTLIGVVIIVYLCNLEECDACYNNYCFIHYYSVLIKRDLCN